MSRWVRSSAFASAIAAIALTAATPGGAAGEGPSVETVLAQSRAALGLDALPRLRTVHLHGASDLLGIKGSTDAWQDVRNGTFATYNDAGPLSVSQGYDGAHAWTRDAGGVVWSDDGIASRLATVDAVYQTRYLLWSKDRGRATVTSAGVKAEGDRRYDVLRVTPPGGVAYDIWIDAATHLPQRTVSVVGTSTNVATFDDYRTVEGVKIPFVQNDDSDGNVTKFSATSVTVNEPAAPEALRRPPMHVTDTTLASGTTTIPVDLVDNHVVLPVTINGKGPFNFAFDTGGLNFIDSGIANELGLSSVGNASSGGVGSASEAVRFATVDALGVGDATLRKQVFIVAPVRTGFGVASGKPVDGLIGFEVLSRFVTTFDYEKKQVVLRTPGRAVPAGGTTIPFVFNGQHVDVACTIASFAGRCTIDTGDRLSLNVLSPFIAAHPAIVPSNAAAVGASGYGVGGASLGRLGRTTLQLGNIVIPDLITDFSTQTRGALADPFTAGNIGAGTLKRFTVTFDYGRQTMTLVPNASFAERDSYDRSGTFLISQGGKIIVADVRPGTPAADAGLVRGDVLTAIDGKDASTYDLATIRTLFHGSAGTAIPLTVTAKTGTARTLTLTLRDYV